ncbi:alpha/beta hydrolase [Marinobacter fuscus]|uniref:Alpha/beta hydrolase n=1 Tax=Marinobacter fuscus TaxID=2109942 RepID=A0A2T1K629_9GAMM|nr:alpha/beta fold hydrolase [Marinobacter fuscus]PSF04972.1 alpha/beta hydrolase [Marinobacter fuscus]
MTRITSEGFGKGCEKVIILAHGAGAPMDSPFMTMLAQSLAGEGIESLRFEFPYMAQRRADGRKRPPNRQPVLLDAFREQVAGVRAELGDGCEVWIGGKSMGGRMASILASESPELVSGVVCFGYPFHPPGKPDKWRTEHFASLSPPTAIIQGSRDPFGKQLEVQARAPLPGNIRLCWLEGGDHDFRPLARQPQTQPDLIVQAARYAGEFMLQASG